jgi:hypothetical protein
LDDSFCRVCGYMASIPKMPPTVVILIAEGERVIIEPAESAVYQLVINVVLDDEVGLALQAIPLYRLNSSYVLFML